MHTYRCGQAPFLFIWSCRRKVVETRKSRIRVYPWIVVWSCSCSTPQYSANRSIRKQHQKTSLDRGKLSRFFSGTIWAPPCTVLKKQKLFLVLLGLAWWQEHVFGPLDSLLWGAFCCCLWMFFLGRVHGGAQIVPEKNRESFPLSANVFWCWLRMLLLAEYWGVLK